MQNSSLPTNLVANIEIDKNNVKWIGTAEGMVKIEGNNWFVYDSANTPFGIDNIAPRAIDKFNNLWVSLAGKGIAKFDGANWTLYDTTNSGIPANAVSCITIDSNNTKWIGTVWGIGKFDDVNWIIFRTTNSGLPANFVSSIAVENHVKWIGTFGLYGGMAEFNDTNWIVYNTTNSGIPNNTIHDIKVDSWGIKWLGTHFGGGVGRYNSIANSWIVYNTQNSGLPDGYVYSVLVQNHIKWFGTQGGGLARFNDTGWVVFNTYNSPMPGYSVLDLELDSNKNLWICVSGGLAIYNPTGIVGNITSPQVIPQKYSLYQNFPNPFNSSTKIRFDISKAGLGSIIIYDVRGREVFKFATKYYYTGNYELTWQADNFPSGIYFYRLESGSYTETKKMVLLK